MAGLTATAGLILALIGAVIPREVRVAGGTIPTDEPTRRGEGVVAVEETPVDEEFDDEFEERLYLTPWYVWVLRAVGILGLVVGVLVAAATHDLGAAALSIAMTVVWGAIVFMFAETANHVAVMRQQFEYLLDLIEIDVRES